MERVAMDLDVWRNGAESMLFGRSLPVESHTRHPLRDHNDCYIANSVRTEIRVRHGQ